MLLSKTKPGGHAQPGLQVSSVHLSILGSARSAHVLVQEQLLYTQPEGPGEGLKYIFNGKMLLKYKNSSWMSGNSLNVCDFKNGCRNKAVSYLQIT